MSLCNAVYDMFICGHTTFTLAYPLANDISLLLDMPHMGSNSELERMQEQYKILYSLSTSFASTLGELPHLMVGSSPALHG